MITVTITVDTGDGQMTRVTREDSLELRIALARALIAIDDWFADADLDRMGQAALREIRPAVSDDRS